MSSTSSNDAASTAGDPRAAAIDSLKRKREFSYNLVSYVIVNAFMWAIWALTGMGYPWPVWVMVPWGVGLAFHAWQVYGQKPITEADIDREMHRQSGA